MAENTTLPDKTINYNVYDDGNRLLGTATIELPELAYISDTLSGSGLAGEIETGVIGHFQALSVTINWNAITEESVKLLANTSKTLTFRVAQQKLDTAETKQTVGKVKIVVRTLPKSLSLGSLEMGQKTDSNNVMEVPYIKVEIDDNEVLEIDKLNNICKIDGEDLLTDVRSALGL